MAFKLSEKIGEKYRIQTEKGGFLRQMGPRKLSKDRAEYRIAVLNGEEPYNYPDDEVSEAITEATDAAIQAYIDSQSAQIAKYSASYSVSQQNYLALSESLADLEAGYHADPPTVTEEEYAASSSALQTSMSKAEATMSKCEASMSKYQDYIDNAETKVTNVVVTEIPEVLTLGNSNYNITISGSFSDNEVTTIQANEKLDKGVTLRNTGDPANVVINVGNSDVTLYANTQWNEVVVESVADSTLTVATSVHINKLVVKKGRVWVNNALIEDCIDEVVVEGGVVEANPEINATKVGDLYSKPSVVNINSDLTANKNITTGILTSGHYIYHNNAKVQTNGTGSGSSGYLIRGSKLVMDFYGSGEWKSLTNPTIWLSDFDGLVRIYDGKFTNEGGHAETIYAEKGFIEIYGGEFHNVDDGTKNFLLNCLDANYQSGKAGIKVFGGKFYGFDPAANGAESSDDSTNFVAEGYESIFNEEGSYYEVKPING